MLTNEQRLRRHLCQIGTCNKSLERLEHVFKQCSRAHQVWLGLYSKESKLGHAASSFMVVWGV